MDLKRVGFLCTGLVMLSTGIMRGQNDQDSLCWQFRMAAFDNDSASVLFFLHTSDVDIDCFVWGETNALGYAVQEGHYGMAELLLAYDANPDGVEGIEISPLNLAVIHNETEIAELLILYGASPDRSDATFITPLIRSIRQGNFLMVDMLMHYGANPHLPMSDGSTALHIAAMYRDYEMADRIIECGADVNATDNKGYTPLMIAASLNDTLLGQRLLNAGATPGVTNSDGWNALALAIRWKSPGMVRLLAPYEQKPLHEDLSNLSLIHRNRKSNAYLKLNGLTPGLKPTLIAHHLTLGISMSGKDRMTLYHYGLHELRYNVVVSIGFENRSNPATVFYAPQGADTVLYQMKGTRRHMLLGFEKRFSLFNLRKGEIDLALALKPGYSWGSFAGSSRKPWHGFATGYSAGLLLDQYWVSCGIHYQYQDYRDTPVPPHRIGLTFSLHLRDGRYRLKPKNIPYELSE